MILNTKMLSGETWFKAIVIRANGKMESEIFKCYQNAEAFINTFEGK